MVRSPLGPRTVCAYSGTWTVCIINIWRAGWNPHCQFSHRVRKLGRQGHHQHILNSLVQPKSNLISRLAIPSPLSIFFGLTASKVSDGGTSVLEKEGTKQH